jgi:hypothetical protein
MKKSRPANKAESAAHRPPRLVLPTPCTRLERRRAPTAAMGLAVFPHLDEIILNRKKVVETYQENLKLIMHILHSFLLN